MSKYKIIFIVIIVLLFTGTAYGEIRAGSLVVDDFFTFPEDDNTLILYANFWETEGRSVPGDEIIITFGKIKKTIKATRGGYFKLQVGAAYVGGPADFTIRSARSGDQIVIKNLVIIKHPTYEKESKLNPESLHYDVFPTDEMHERYVITDISYLRYAVVNDDFAKVKELVAKGVKVNLDYFDTDIAKCEDPEIIKYLIDHGLEVKRMSDVLFYLVDDYGSKSAAITKILIEAGLSVHAEKGKYTILSMALYNGAWEVAKYLIKNGADIKKAACFDRPAILWASYSQDKELIELMLKKGADLNEEGLFGMTIYSEYVYEKDSKQWFNYLVSKGLKKNAYFDHSPVNDAFINNDFELIKKLSKEELEARIYRNRFGAVMTALHLAVEKGDLDLIKAINKKKVNWNVVDLYQRTPLLLALIENNYEITEYLLKNGADPNKPAQMKSFLKVIFPIEIAAIKSLDMVKLLLKYKADPTIDAKDGEIVTDNIDPTEKMHYDVDPALLRAVLKNDIPMVKLLLKKGCDINIGALEEGTSNGMYYENSLVFEAADLGYVEMTNFLINKKAPVKKGAAFYKKLAVQKQKQYGAEKKEMEEEFRVTRKKGPLSEKRGLIEAKFDTTFEGYDVYDQKLDIYIPGDYDGSEPYGLMVYVHATVSNHGRPGSAYQKILAEKKIIWVGFDAYADEYSQTEQQSGVALSAVYNMKQQFNIDPARVYVGGLSKGGLTAGPLLEYFPEVFKGALVNARLGSPGYMSIINKIRGYPDHPVVMATGDFDYNIFEVYNSYIEYMLFGRHNAYYIQEAERQHNILRPVMFERALEALDNHNR